MSATKISKTPRYLKLAEQLRSEVLSGKRQPGERLPSCAEMKEEHGLSQHTWEKAHHLLEQEGIVTRTPNKGVFVAKPKARTATGVIGIMMGAAASRHPYYTLVLKGIHEAAEKAAVDVLLFYANSTVKWEKVDGLIMMGGVDVSFGNLVPGMPRFSLLRSIEGAGSLITDDAAGVTQLMEHLLTLGHKKIAFLTMTTPENADPVAALRIRAYKKALTEAGIKVDRRWMRGLRSDNGPVRKFSDLGNERMAQWLREDWKQLGCTALLCQNDDTAIGAIEALRVANVRVPEDVSVVGYDGTEISAYYRPKLTTVELPLEAMGARAVEYLLGQIDRPLSAQVNEKEQNEIIVMPVHVVIGESTAQAAVAATK